MFADKYQIIVSKFLAFDFWLHFIVVACASITSQLAGTSHGLCKLLDSPFGHHYCPVKKTGFQQQEHEALKKERGEINYMVGMTIIMKEQWVLKTAPSCRCQIKPVRSSASKHNPLSLPVSFPSESLCRALSSG